MSEPIAIPAAIWEQDQNIWRAWVKQSNASMSTLAQYKRIIKDFYFAIDGSILTAQEEDLALYEDIDQALYAEKTVARDMRVIRAYWTFAKQQAEVRHE